MQIERNIYALVQHCKEFSDFVMSRNANRVEHIEKLTPSSHHKWVRYVCKRSREKGTQIIMRRNENACDKLT